MRILYFDGSNGISGDMILNALTELGKFETEMLDVMQSAVFSHEEHHHGRSYHDVRQIITESGFSDKAKEIALAIYTYIAEAEASVHGETLETIHFHEVGRDEAIKNAIGIGMAIEAIKANGSDEGDQSLEILISPIYDGKGTVVCSHGEIPVPVPAVMALRSKCTYIFETADVNMEMVTPSGLASLMGIKAKPAVRSLQQMLEDPRVKLVAETEAKGSRDTGRGGLKVYLLDCDVYDNVPFDRRDQ